MDWYKRIKPKRPKSERARRSKRETLANPMRARNPITIRSEKSIYFARYSRAISINGLQIKVCTRNSIAEYFGTENTTILRWGDRGVLPEPFYHIDDRGKRIPVYLTGQVLVLRKVVADLVRDGFVSIPWAKLDEHIEMLQNGYEEAANRVYRKFETDNSVDKVDRFGVVFT